MDFKKTINEIKESGLSWGEIAESLGYSGQKKTYDIGHGKEGMSKPAQTALNYLAQGFLSKSEKRMIPEFVIGDTDEHNREIIVRLHWPRFVGVICEEVELGKWPVEHIKVIEDEVIAIAFWIDRPLNQAEEVLIRAAQFVNRISR